MSQQNNLSSMTMSQYDQSFLDHNKIGWSQWIRNSYILIRVFSYFSNLLDLNYIILRIMRDN